MTKQVSISVDGENWFNIEPMSIEGPAYEPPSKIVQPHAPFTDDMDDISCLRVDLYDCVKHPSDYLKECRPKEYLEMAWIPQTMGDQIWVMYKFKSVEERILWESSLTGVVKECLDRDLIEYALQYGWVSRDHNGFVVD